MTRPTMSGIRFHLSALGMLAILILPQRVWADAPTSQPVDDTPQAFLVNVTNDVVAPMSVDQAMALVGFNPNSDKDIAGAKLLAMSIIEQSKLELAVRGKWGKDAETAVAHDCADNLPSDAATAKWDINVDHATATFQIDSLTPMLLVNENGHWKIDLAGYRQANATMDKDMQAATALCDRLTQDLANKDAYPAADAFIKHVKEENDKLSAAN